MRDDFTPSPDNPLCGCGCGQPVPIYQRTNKRFGMKRGEFAKFVSGHNRKKYSTDEEHREASRRNQKTWRERHPWSTRRPTRGPVRRRNGVSVSHKEYMDQHYEERRQWYRTLKAGKPCKRCGVVPDSTNGLHFHHRDPATKVSAVSTMALVRRIDQVLAEAEKCDLLCVPCHRAVHKEIGRPKRSKRTKGDSHT